MADKNERSSHSAVRGAGQGQQEHRPRDQHNDAAEPSLSARRADAATAWGLQGLAELGCHAAGWDEDGGYADYAVVPDAYAYALARHSTTSTPRRCSARASLATGPGAARPCRRAGVWACYGFGASAHLCAQVALHEGAAVRVLTRDRGARQRALALGAASAGDTLDAPPEPLDAAIVFAPVGTIVPAALAALDRGGTLAIAGIHVSQVPALDYQTHLFFERQLRSVTANTRQHGRDFLALAARIPCT